MDPLRARLAANLSALRGEIDVACAAAGRDAGEVELVAISKYATALETAALAAAMAEVGLPPILGESRVQALTQKAAELDADVRWDLVGSLQRNKAVQATRVFDRIHSLDRPAILQQLDQVAEASGRTIPGFLQVNVSSEEAKHGFAPDALPAALDLAASLPRIEVRGLMGMAPRGTDHETARPAFAALRELRDRHASDLPHLSMGMSGDFKGAILEGATVLRIGSAVFASREG